jgi:hypothetical protein
MNSYLKIYGLVGLLIFINTAGFAQKIKPQNLPDEVKTAFFTAYPNAENPKWTRENDHHYEVDFRITKSKCSAVYTSEGKLVEAEIALKWIEVPIAVRQTILLQFKAYKVKEVEKKILPEQIEQNFYEVEIQKAGEKLEILLDESGKIIKQSKD